MLVVLAEHDIEEFAANLHMIRYDLASRDGIDELKGGGWEGR